MDEGQLILLYQAGIANVFYENPGGRLTRLLQSDYRSCMWYAQGWKHHGGQVVTMHWDKAGDAALFRKDWLDGAGDLWAEKKMVVE